jgi:hypothetical protein
MEDGRMVRDQNGLPQMNTKLHYKSNKYRNDQEAQSNTYFIFNFKIKFTF